MQGKNLFVSFAYRERYGGNPLKGSESGESGLYFASIHWRAANYHQFSDELAGYSDICYQLCHDYRASRFHWQGN